MNKKSSLMLGLLLASISIGAATNKAVAQASIPAQLSIQLDKPLHPSVPCSTA